MDVLLAAKYKVSLNDHYLRKKKQFEWQYTWKELMKLLFYKLAAPMALVEASAQEETLPNNSISIN